MYAAKILADSIAVGAEREPDVRLTTMEVTFPRFILAEFNTHRVFSRNSASSRAIPVEKRIAQVRENPFVPEAFTKNKKGMQADDVLDRIDADFARAIWLDAAEEAAKKAEALMEYGVHKQHANRILEPYAWHTVVVSATEWQNFFNLRTHKAAQPEMQITAKLMLATYEASMPHVVQPDDWHLPYTTEEEREADIALAIKMSVVRCAAVSFERQYTERTREQIEQRHDEMRKLAHWSPFEHQARVITDGEAWGQYLGHDFIGNFRNPWEQYRKHFRDEAVWTGGDAS